MTNSANISLLVVENDLKTLELLQNLISKRFPTMIVNTACNPAEAIDKYNDKKYEIVLTDLFDPQMFGLIVAREVCEINPDTLVVFITTDTGTHWDSIKHKAKRLCLLGIIHKPIQLPEVIDKIEEAIGIINKRAEK
jgi:DNA-binding NarL/FixJ family response regulator